MQSKFQQRYPRVEFRCFALSGRRLSSVDALLWLLEKKGCEQLAVINLITSQQPLGPIWEAEVEDWEMSFNLNLMLSVDLLNRFISAALSINVPTSIVLFAGAEAIQSQPGLSAVSTSKAALVRLVESTYADLQQHGYDKLIKLNVVDPGCAESSTLQEKPQPETEGASPMAVANLVQQLCDHRVNKDVSGNFLNAQDDHSGLFQ
jgi:NAD(P)-dependent dehydrogenase (short-subunit alcohol dehydrogenase family)